MTKDSALKRLAVIYQIVAPLLLFTYIWLRLPYYLYNEPKLGGLLCAFYCFILICWYLTINHLYLKAFISKKVLYLLETGTTLSALILFFFIFKLYT